MLVVCGMSFLTVVLRGAQNVCISRWRNVPILIKTLLLKLIFQNEGHLFYILSVYCKFLLFQFLNSGIRMHIPILAGVQDKRISKNAKITHILSIGDFQVASNCVFRNITKKLILSFLSMLFLLFCI